VADNSIRLSVEVETAAATKDVKAFAQTTTTLDQTAATATRSLAAVSTSTRTMGQAFAGAGPAIGGAAASLQLLGVQGPPALQTLASAAASLAVSGFGPLGIAITAAVAAISFFAAETKAAVPEITLHEKALDGLASTYDRLNASANQAAQRARGLELGKPGELVGLESQVRQLEVTIAGLQADRRDNLSALRQSGFRPRAGSPGLSEIDDQIKEFEKQLREAKRNVALFQDRVAADIRDTNLQASRILADPGYQGSPLADAIMQQFLGSRAISSRPKSVGGGDLGDPFARFQGVQPPEPFGRTLEQAQAEARDNAAFGETARGFRAERDARLALSLGDFGDVAGTGDAEASRAAREAGAAAARAAEEAARPFNALAEGFGSNLRSQIVGAFKSGDVETAAMGVAEAFGDAMLAALAEGLVQASGVEDFAASLFTGIGGAAGAKTPGDIPVGTTG